MIRTEKLKQQKETKTMKTTTKTTTIYTCSDPKAEAERQLLLAQVRHFIATGNVHYPKPSK